MKEILAVLRVSTTNPLMRSWGKHEHRKNREQGHQKPVPPLREAYRISAYAPYNFAPAKGADGLLLSRVRRVLPDGV